MSESDSDGYASESLDSCCSSEDFECVCCGVEETSDEFMEVCLGCMLMYCPSCCRFWQDDQMCVDCYKVLRSRQVKD